MRDVENQILEVDRKKNDSVERRLAKAEARIKYLTAENELLKKLDALEREAKHRN